MSSETFNGWLVVGLGNPDREYAGTRHNAGFLVVDLLARRWSARDWLSRFHGKFTQAAPSGIDGTVLLLEPLTYMNLSGKAVQGAMTFYRVPPARTLVIHDDMDLEFGTLRLKVGGGSAGHRGLESISAAVGPDYLRLRFGIGRPERADAVDHVLSRFTPAERAEMELHLEKAADMVEAALREGPQAAMNAHHKRRKAKPEEPDEPD
jgi:peptidyl-tRNA hydrolase, PTH1 family